MSIRSKKIGISGEAEVIQNSLINSSVDYQFGVEYLSTVGVRIYRKLIEIPGAEPPDKLKLHLLIWNLAEKAKFKGIAPSYLQGSSGAVIVADVSRPETVERLPEHIQLFLSVNSKGSIIVALNKSDLIDKEKLEKLIQMVQLQGMERVLGIYQTSAKTGSSVDEIFQQLAYKSLEAI